MSPSSLLSGKDQSFSFALQPDFSYQSLFPAASTGGSSLLSATPVHRFQPRPIPLHTSPPPISHHFHERVQQQQQPHHHHQQHHHPKVANSKPLVTVTTITKKVPSTVNKVQPSFVSRTTTEKPLKSSLFNQFKLNHTHKHNVPISTGAGSILEPRAQASEFRTQKFMMEPLPNKHMIDPATLEALAQAAYEAGSSSAHLHLKSIAQQQQQQQQQQQRYPQTQSMSSPTPANQPPTQYSQPQQPNYQASPPNSFQPIDSGVAQPQVRTQQSKPHLLQIPRLRVLEYEEQHRAALSEFARALEQLDLRSMREHEVKHLPIIDAKHLTGEHLNNILQQNQPNSGQDESTQKAGRTDDQWVQPPSVGYVSEPATMTSPPPPPSPTTPSSPMQANMRSNYGRAQQPDAGVPIDDEPQSYNAVPGGSRNEMVNRIEYGNRSPDYQPFKPAYVSDAINSNYAGVQPMKQSIVGSRFQPPPMQYFNVNDCTKKRMKQNMPMLVTPPSPPPPPLPPMEQSYSAPSPPATLPPASPLSPSPPSPSSLSNYGPMRSSNMWSQLSDFQGSLNQLVSFDDTSNYLSSASAMHRMRLNAGNGNNGLRSTETSSLNNERNRKRDWPETIFGNNQSSTYFKASEESGGNRFDRNHHYHNQPTHPSTPNSQSTATNNYENDRNTLADLINNSSPNNPNSEAANGNMFISSLNGNSAGNYSKELNALMEAVMMNSPNQQLLPTKLDMRVIHLPVSVLKRLVGEERRKRK